jgi:hypothetical protein
MDDFLSINIDLSDYQELFNSNLDTKIILKLIDNSKCCSRCNKIIQSYNCIACKFTIQISDLNVDNYFESIDGTINFPLCDYCYPISIYLNYRRREQLKLIKTYNEFKKASKEDLAKELLTLNQNREQDEFCILMKNGIKLG